MSEYQYYEFQAIDAPLTKKQIAELRSCSTRATITSTRFTNEYNWGDLKGDPQKWMEKYFDAFLYVANWGSHWLELKIPKRTADLDAITEYCLAEWLSYRVSGKNVILSFQSETEDFEWEEGDGWLASLIPLRQSLMEGDYRCLYLGWLADAERGYFENDDLEPPVPPGLGSLNATLDSLADFLRIDIESIVAAAEESGDLTKMAPTKRNIANWVAKMPSEEKDEALVALVSGTDPHFPATFRQRVLREIRDAQRADSRSNEQKRRTVGQLMERAEIIADRRRAEEAREREKEAQARAEARRKRIKTLVGKSETLWRRVERLIAEKKAGGYDMAVSILRDLRDLAELENQRPSFNDRLEALCREHSRKSTLMQRIEEAQLRN